MAESPFTPAPTNASSSQSTVTGPLVYAGFGSRLVALLIDSLLFSFAGAILNLTFSFSLLSEEQIFSNSRIVVSLLVMWIYWAGMESSAQQATLGKRVMNIRVTREDGGRLTFWQASLRFFGKLLSGAILYIGFIMAAFTKKSQGLHDLIAGTVVIKNQD